MERESLSGGDESRIQILMDDSRLFFQLLWFDDLSPQPCILCEFRGLLLCIHCEKFRLWFVKFLY